MTNQLTTKEQYLAKAKHYANQAKKFKDSPDTAAYYKKQAKLYRELARSLRD